MGCEYCRQSGGHPPGCPNRDPPGDYLNCHTCGVEIHFTKAKRLETAGEPYCLGCYREELERLWGRDQKEEE